jgi:transcriptional antiterminator RfaH
MELIYLTKSILTRSWMVIYTRPRWEKKVDQLLQTQGINSYCPVKRMEHEWADRKKIVDVPLFSSYLFVKINPHEESRVRQTLGVVNFIYFQGKPAKVSEKIIEDIKHFTTLCPDMEVINLKELSVGDRVTIKSGAFVNQTGNVLEIQGKQVIMMLDTLGCIIVAKVPSNKIIIA